MKKDRFFIGVTFLSLLALSVAGCGSSSSDNSGGATPEGDDAATGSGTSAALSSGLGGASSGVSGAGSLIKAAIKGGTLTIELDEEETVDCGTSGDATLSLEGTVDIDDDTGEGSINISSTMTFNECTENASVTLDTGDDCSFSATMDGEVTCTIAGDVTDMGETFSMDFSCNTAAACSGLTVTIDGTDHTVGVDFGASFTTSDPEGTEPTLTGTVCIDGTEFDFEDIDDVEVASGELTCS